MNGVSLDVTGVIVVRTIGNTTVFVALSGQNSAIVQGVEYQLWTGQQIIVDYAPGDFSQPIGIGQVYFAA